MPKLLISIFLNLSFFSQLVIADIAIIDTKGSKRTKDLVSFVRDNCYRCGDVNYYDMRGLKKNGERIINEIGENSKINLMLTLGWPATEVASKSLPERITLLYADSRDTDLTVKRRKSYRVPLSPSYEVQMKIISRVFPEAKSIGLVYSSGKREELLRNFSAAARELGVEPNLYEVEEPKQVPLMVKKAVEESELLIFMRDERVVNAESYKFIIQTALEGGIPTLSYSRALVKYGMFAAIFHNKETIAKFIEQVVGGILDNKEIDAESVFRGDYRMLVNAYSLKRVNGASFTDINVDFVD